MTEPYHTRLRIYDDGDRNITCLDCGAVLLTAEPSGPCPQPTSERLAMDFTPDGWPTPRQFAHGFSYPQRDPHTDESRGTPADTSEQTSL